MPSVLLDTHILLWWRLEPERLSQRQVTTLEHLERSRQPVAISAITLWELANLEHLGRIGVAGPVEQWLEEIERNPLVEVLPLTARIVFESVGLGEDFHRDPADRIIVATARCHGLQLMTADRRIRQWGKVPIV